ncbi:hypothetical protein CAPTEDRAFT_106368 [Capitella teleta]|uniref:PITH domain-containing protein n=1 Tax=Capitella teleta TaxID=283909 RepID=R7UEG7_CAPTE|nr:hypothetical protein CAPTEDRAFT_106368 [Capitella teleta]|eukprot:ELU04369.1 hypothetical protein CAPTEDRAFT_106368 [Capitella teleta]
MAGHGHSHGCGGCDHSDELTVSEAELASQYSLFQKIDTFKVQCLNEVVDGSGKEVFKPWDQRLNVDKASSSIIARHSLPQSTEKSFISIALL